MDRKLVIPIIILIFTFLTSCAHTTLPETTPTVTHKTSTPRSDEIMEKLNKMTLEEKIGQLVMVGVEGKTLDSNIKELVVKHYVGGVILFKKNIKSATQAAAFINSIKEVNSVNKLPIFISVDEEGGRISRMPDEFKKIPSARDIGKKNKENLSFGIGSAIASMIGQMGFNMDFAPVLDINSNPLNKVIDDRALGSEPDIVKRLGVSTMKGLQSKNIIPVVKHFPGHGDTTVDSHKGLPVIDHSLDRLQNFEFIPFAEAIQNDADTVMIAHILMKKIDEKYPASMSYKIVNNILRNNMGFQGVVVTDDLTMGAIEKNFVIDDAAVKSFNAGCDILLVCHGYDKELKVIEALKRAAEDGTISKKRIDESVYRIIQLKVKYGLTDTKNHNVDIRNINREIERVLEKG
ncbi:beta-N-acetylhexosaminidase [Pseudobacteroides cellulosolvens]|uniref:Beta-N-acetylhexosaminidase n=1 Tax=Pseudobacteroides cellulosolvens ATCC 35603 = DSM 2933 TaxID=398512 RepID=A0A0L6JVZ2_9FIRM|nr:beta-N-acetylhexosaminidase [Pseudobacteroides cellulosolvens]KNY30036.1 Beta-N-acetylhexosaminidase [Pseudobacteroides cellulosolvens ATCC 35603 = DSM 2933]